MTTAALCAAVASLSLIGTAAIGRAASSPGPVSVCVDSSSPSAAIDTAVARAAFAAEKRSVVVHTFFGGAGVADRYFNILAHRDCRLIMGFPVDLLEPDPPDKLELTKPYVHTGYVLATLNPKYLKHLPGNALVAVGAATSPNFYVVGALPGPQPNLRADTFQTQEGALDALSNHTDPVAMVWYLSLRRYIATHPAAHIGVSQLNFPHARWDIAALYDPKTSAPEARTFERGVALLAREGRLTSVTGPTLPE